MQILRHLHVIVSPGSGLMRGFERLPENEQQIAKPVYHSFPNHVYADPPYHTICAG